jgi:hypothetical protein
MQALTQLLPAFFGYTKFIVRLALGGNHMALKTYVPHLRVVLKVAHKYATRYQTQLSAVLTPDQYACLTDTIQALSSCLALLGTTPLGE